MMCDKIVAYACRKEITMVKQLHGRKLTFFVISFVFAMLISEQVSRKSAIITVIALTAVIPVLILLRRLFSSKIIKEAVLIIPIILGIISGTLFQHYTVDKERSKITRLGGSECQICAVIEEVTYTSDYFSAYTVRVIELDGKDAGFKASLEIPFDPGAEENDVIRLNVKLSLPETDQNGFPLREYYAARSIYLCAKAADENVKIIGYDRSIPAFFRNLSHSLSTKLLFSLGSESGGFVSGLLLGRKSDIPDRLNTSFRYLGISHVLSVSGLHLTILTALLMLFLGIFQVPYWPRTLLSVVFIISFILLTGARPSVMRSGIMLLLMILAGMISRDYDAPNALSFAAIVIILISPSSIHDSGFLLSVFATAGIIALGVPCTRWLFHAAKGRPLIARIALKATSSFAITTAATLFTLPIMYRFFGEISPLSVITNLIFIPLCTVLMYLSVLLLIFFGTPLSSTFAAMTASLSKFITYLSYTLTDILPEPLNLTYDFVPIVITMALAVLVLFTIKKKKGLALILSASVFAVSYFSFISVYKALHKNEATVVCVTSGENDYILVNVNGKTLMCDFSNGGYSSAMDASSLSKTEVHDFSPDVILLTHLHRKHIDMIARLADNNRISQLFIPSPQNDDEQLFADAVSAAAQRRGISVTSYHSDKDVTFDFEGVKLTLYKRTYIERSVQPLHLLVIEDKQTLVYAGRALTESPLADELYSELKSCDILFLGTHGPLIKAPLPSLNFDGKIIVSDPEINNEYKTSFKVIDFYYKCKLKS